MTGDDKRAVWSLVAGFIVWSGAFVLLYALQALGCAYGWSQHRLVLCLAFVVASLPLVWLAFWQSPADGEPASSLSVIALWANRAALGATVLVFLGPIAATSPCL